MNNDQIEQFKQFMEFIQNVDKYKQTIEDLQSATKDYNKAVAALEFGDSLLDAKDHLEADRVKFTKDVQDANDSFVKLSQVKEQYFADKANTLGNKEAELMQKERELTVREQNVVKEEDALFDMKARVEQDRVKVQAAQQDVQDREVALTNKASQIQQLLG